MILHMTTQHAQNYWLMKSEGDCYGIDDLARDGTTSWEGVRNYQARNFMTQHMRIGDRVLFYHSNSTPSGVYGIAEVATAAHPDQSQFKKPTKYELANDMSHYDPKSTTDTPIWHCVDVAFVSKARTPLSLALIKADPSLEGMLVRANGSRLSIQPVTEKHFLYIQKMISG
jgi:predicted RNA-binding protein with PUA-like domain